MYILVSDVVITVIVASIAYYLGDTTSRTAANTKVANIDGGVVVVIDVVEMSAVRCDVVSTLGAYEGVVFEGYGATGKTALGAPGNGFQEGIGSCRVRY